MTTSARLIANLEDARARTLELIEDLTPEQLLGPKLDIVNPMLWEIGHIAWFHEKWTLRDLFDMPPARDDADALYDSIAIAHDRRWDLPLPSLDETLEYMAMVLERMERQIDGREPTEKEVHHYRYTTFHEDMHAEAFTYTRQTHGWSPPDLEIARTERVSDSVRNAGQLDGDVDVPGGSYLLGAQEGRGFAFDNEKWAHRVELAPFSIARAPVTNAEFAEFVDAGGYRERRFWSDAGWSWRTEKDAENPVYWREGVDGWEVRTFDQWTPLPPNRPISHVNWYEAHAYCEWAGRRLPTEAEWEVAASVDVGADGQLAQHKRRFPWGEQLPDTTLANLDGRALGTVDVAAFPQGDSPLGCRQMIGNVWEWTSSVFEPFEGFEPDFYVEYSEPWFGDRRVLRGGSWATRPRLIWNTFRNFFTPDRRDIIAGFRTCAV